ncbi:MAG TPA: hypothetical protein VLX92_23570 [Kofleriaceae bacterium]|nr:hypothetical protein [Kofleriaceae bacterium]
MTPWVVLGTIAIVAAMIGGGVLLDRRIGVLPRPRELAAPPDRGPHHAPGEAPETALAGPLDRRRHGQRCPACRARMSCDPASDQVVRYGDRELVVIALVCPKCAAHRGLYVARA